MLTEQSRMEARPPQAGYTVIVLCVLSLLAGCAPSYVAPTLENSAKLRFKASTGARTTLSRVHVSACPPAPEKEVVAITSDDVFSPGEVSKVGMIGGSEASEKRIRERLVPAGRPFFYEISTPAAKVEGAYVYACTLSGVFTPQLDAEYELEYAIGDRQCSSGVFRLSKGGAGEVLRVRERSHRQVKVDKDADYCAWRDQHKAEALFDNLLPEPESFESASPAPTPSPPPDAMPSADGVSSLAPPAQAASWQPRVGDRWNYALSSSGRRLGTVSIEIVESTRARVKEHVTRNGYPEFLKERSVDWPFSPRQFQETVTLPGGYLLAEIAPYFPPGTTIEEGRAWNALPGRFFLPHAGTRTYVMNARVAGQETVRVPAGEFQSWRIEAVSEPDAGAQSTRIRCTFWYSPVLSRTVKMNMKVESSYLAARSDDTYDLVSFEPGQ